MNQDQLKPLGQFPKTPSVGRTFYEDMLGFVYRFCYCPYAGGGACASGERAGAEAQASQQGMLRHTDGVKATGAAHA